MFWQRGTPLGVSAGIAVLALAACSESVTPPEVPAAFPLSYVEHDPPTATTGHGQPPPNGQGQADVPILQPSMLVICLNGDVGGTFQVRSNNAAVAGSPFSLQPLTCRTVYTDNTSPGSVDVGVVDVPNPSNVTMAFETCDNGQAGCPGKTGGNSAFNLIINQFHGAVLVFRHTLRQPPPPPGHEPPPPNGHGP